MLLTTPAILEDAVAIVAAVAAVLEVIFTAVAAVLEVMTVVRVVVAAVKSASVAREPAERAALVRLRVAYDHMYDGVLATCRPTLPGVTKEEVATFQISAAVRVPPPTVDTFASRFVAT